MNRRKFLLGTLGSIAGLSLTGARAETDFEAFRRQQQGGFAGFRQTQQDEFDSYRKEMEVAFEAYQRRFAEAVKAQQDELRAYWRDPLLSDSTRWVEYSADKAIQRIVDFDKNEITIRLHSKDAKVDAALLRRELSTVLSADQAEAFKRDPVAQAVEQAVVEAAPNAVQQAPVRPQLVLGELFSSSRPSAREIERTTERLAERAVETRNSPVTLTVPLPDERPARKAAEYQALVRKHAERWQVEPALVLAVMHTESSFNPMARSPVPAYGLMQIVPSSAGKDATQLVHGKPRVVAPSYLYDADRNIELGAAYLHILLYRYLRAVENPESRLYCAVAAYNTGAGNVARSYTGGTSVASAARLINQRAPRANFEHMSANLPYEETRHYLQRVVARLPVYRQL